MVIGVKTRRNAVPLTAQVPRRAACSLVACAGGGSACGTLTLFTLAGAAPCLTPSTPASSIDQPLVSETATVIPARGATGLSMAIIASPAFSSGMRWAISSGRSSWPSVIIASMAG